MKHRQQAKPIPDKIKPKKRFHIVLISEEERAKYRIPTYTYLLP